MLAELDEKRPELPADVREQVDINLKYDGYIRRQKQQVAQFKKLEGRKIPADLDYTTVNSLRREAVQKLNLYKPENIGQASRNFRRFTGRYLCPDGAFRADGKEII